MGDDVTALLVALSAENAELRQQLSTAQDMLIETAIDAGHLHARIEALQAELAATRAERDALAQVPEKRVSRTGTEVSARS